MQLIEAFINSLYEILIARGVTSHMHIFCLNESIFGDFGYDWYFTLSLFIVLINEIENLS